VSWLLNGDGDSSGEPVSVRVQGTMQESLTLEQAGHELALERRER